MQNDKPPAITRPSRCAECARYFRDPKRPGYGWCDEFAAAGHISENTVCHPNVGRQIQKEDRDGK